MCDVTDDPIDLVLVTGAGASREFGVNRTNLPLMAEWSASLLRKLREVPGFADAVGLQDGMTGPAFEDRLGVFLGAAEAFPRIKTLVEPLGKMLSATAPATIGGNLNNSWDAWHGQAQFQLEQVFGRIYESLYENFEAPQYDPGLVQGAYAALLTQLGINENAKWVYATTNYDVIADAAIQALGGSFDDGTYTARFGGGSERHFRVAGLLQGVGRDIPLLHLHGRVGWLIRPGTGRGTGPYAIDHHVRWESTMGIPLVMLPDPAKDPQRGNPIIGEMWAVFRDALRRARRVLVLGHSLHDVPLIEALAENVSGGRLAVTLLGESDSGELADDAQRVEKTLEESLPNAHRVIMRFGPGYGPGPSYSLREWINATNSAPIT